MAIYPSEWLTSLWHNAANRDGQPPGIEPLGMDDLENEKWTRSVDSLRQQFALHILYKS